MHTPDSAAREIDRFLTPLDPERVPIAEAAWRVTAEDIVTPLSLPPWDNSAMDGFAMRTEDVQGRTPIVLDIIEEIPAGAFPTKPIEPGTCARIFTGAPVPEGADCVIRQEDTTTVDASHVQVDDDRDASRNVRRRGEDVNEGDTVIPSGTELRAAHVGFLMAIAQEDVAVFRRPRVAVLATGDEIADLDERDAILEGRKIGSSNTYSLRQLIVDAGGDPIDLGIALDDPKEIMDRLRSAPKADLILTTAGVSVGEHDYLRRVLSALNLREGFWRIRMRPGAPVGFGLVGALGDTPWIGLPGNPVSAMVTFELFVRPAIRRLRGHRAIYRRTRSVICGDHITLGPKLRHFLRVRLGPPDNPAHLPVAHLTGPQGSGILSSMLKADALMIVPEDEPSVRPGAVMRAIVLDDPAHVEHVPY